MSICRRIALVVFLFGLTCVLVFQGGAQTLPKQTSSVSITIKVFSAFNSSAVKNYAAVLYDSSGLRLDSLIAVDTNVTTFPNVSITGVNSAGETPAGYFLGQNYPNPFNPSSRIRFTVPRSGPVALKTYTILGQEDASLEMTLEPGSYEAEYHPGGAAGVLFYRLITREFTETRKMIQFGGEKTGKSRLTLISSGVRSQSQPYSKVAEHQSNDFMVKLYNLPLTYLPIEDTVIQIAGLTKDTTLNVYVAEAKALPCPGKPTVLYAGKTYNTVQIGTQCWLKENLNVGTMIPGVDTAKDNGTIEKYCYNNDTNNCNTYGGLYQWNEAMQYGTTPWVQGICPTGWRIPTYIELQALATTVGNDGNALKDTTQGTGAGKGTNTSGFSALLAGIRFTNGYFYNLGNYATVWSSAEYGATYANGLTLVNTDGGIGLGSIYEDYGFSVRCLED